jgi:hypothetical protein
VTDHTKSVINDSAGQFCADNRMDKREGQASRTPPHGRDKSGPYTRAIVSPLGDKLP